MLLNSTTFRSNTMFFNKPKKYTITLNTAEAIKLLDSMTFEQFEEKFGIEFGGDLYVKLTVAKQMYEMTGKEQTITYS